jgi:hypothetical protein
MNILEVTAVFLLTLIFYMHVKFHLIRSVMEDVQHTALAQGNELEALLRMKQPLVFQMQFQFAPSQTIDMFYSNNKKTINELRPLGTCCTRHRICPQNEPAIVRSCYRHIIVAPPVGANIKLWPPSKCIYLRKVCSDKSLDTYNISDEPSDVGVELLLEPGQAMYVPPSWGTTCAATSEAGCGAVHLAFYTCTNLIANKVMKAQRLLGI